MDNQAAHAQGVIKLDKVIKKYGSETVVSDVDFSVNAGECIVLVGHNGAGKTTLMKLMLGLTRPTSGQVKILGEDPSLNTSVHNHKTIGYLPESVAFYDAMTGMELLSFYAQLKSASKQDCVELLELVGLEKASHRRISTYSKGMRQRLGLAQAILGNPQLLFLDEPTTGLDPLLRTQFYDLIDNLNKKGVTSIISSHALNEVEARASRFIIMRAGKILANGTLDELYKIANLPVKMKLTVTNGQASNVAQRFNSDVIINNVNNHSLNIDFSNSEKMSLLRHVSSLGDVIEDVQLTSPRLDEVYSHFMKGNDS